jgi:DNA-directed RNA polymerase subunit RPC12/RpoP
MDWDSVFTVLIMFPILLLIFVGILAIGSRRYRCPNCGKKDALQETGRDDENQSKTLKCKLCEHIVIRRIGDGGGCGGCGG